MISLRRTMALAALSLALTFTLVAGPVMAMAKRPTLPAPANPTAIAIGEYNVLLKEYNRVNVIWNAQPQAIHVATGKDMDSYIGFVQEAQEAQKAGNRPGFDNARIQAGTYRFKACMQFTTPC